MTVALPKSVSEAEAKLQLAVRLFPIESLSCGQAAELAGYSKRPFIELLGKQGVDVLNHFADELTDDERAEYTGDVEAIDLVAVLQAEARGVPNPNV